MLAVSFLQEQQIKEAIEAAAPAARISNMKIIGKEIN